MNAINFGNYVVVLDHKSCLGPNYNSFMLKC